MKNLKNQITLFIAAMFSVSAAVAQQEITKSGDEMEGKMKVVIVKDDNGKVEEYKQEFDINDKEAMEKFVEESGVEMKFFEHKGDSLHHGKRMVIEVLHDEEIDGDSDEKKEKLMIMELKGVNAGDMENAFEFNWESDSADGMHKIIKLNCPKDGESFENVFIFDDENTDGVTVKRTQSFIIITRDGKEGEENFATAIKEEKINDMPIENLKMYPNPNKGNFNSEFTVTEPSDVLLSITDSKGSIIYEKELSEFSGTYKENVDLSKEKSGLYFYNLKIGDKVETNKIILQ